MSGLIFMTHFWFFSDYLKLYFGDATFMISLEGGERRECWQNFIHWPELYHMPCHMLVLQLLVQKGKEKRVVDPNSATLCIVYDN